MTKSLKLCILIPVLALAGCVSAGSGSNIKWYNPGTWFSGSAGRKSAQVAQDISTTQTDAIKQAQGAVHATGEALKTVPNSRSTDVAKDSNTTAEELLDQAAGTLTAAKLAAIREQVRLLTSDLAEEREKGAQLKTEDGKTIEAISNKLENLSKLKADTDKALAAEHDKENAIANEYRNSIWWRWFWIIGLGTLFLLCAAGWVYVRLTLGGLPTALSKTVNELGATAPDILAQLKSVLDTHLTPAEQDIIRIGAAKLPSPVIAQAAPVVPNPLIQTP